jgi:D-amino-acid dehydrogenase
MRVIVIGGGLAGIQVAYFLNEDGHEVTVLERREAVARETSFANGGLITPSHATPWNSPGILGTLIRSIGRQDAPIYVRFGSLPQYIGWGLRFVRNSVPARFNQTIALNARLARYSQKCLHQICDRVSPDFAHERRGTIMVYRSAPAFLNARRHVAEMSAHGIRFEILSSAELVKHEPALSGVHSNLAGGIYYPDDEHGNAALYVEALASHLASAGVAIRLGRSVRGFERTSRRVSGVVTDKEVFPADAIVVAAGHWSAPMTRDLGLSLPIRPVKGTSITYSMIGWAEAPVLPVVDDERHVGITPLGADIRIVGTAEFSGDDTAVRPERIALLKRTAVALYPSMANLFTTRQPILEWSGLRPMTPDCLPILGRCGWDNVFLNTGHGYLGWTTGAGTARMVADLVGGSESALRIADYGMERFG